MFQETHFENALQNLWLLMIVFQTVSMYQILLTIHLFELHIMSTPLYFKLCIGNKMRLPSTMQYNLNYFFSICKNSVSLKNM